MYVCMYVYLGLGGVLEVCGECYNIPLLSILFFKTKRNDLARPVIGTIFLVNWASEASPTLGGVQSRFRVIYILYMSVCMSVVCQITWNHVNQTRACSKSVLGGKIRPVTPVLFVSTIR